MTNLAVKCTQIFLLGCHKESCIQWGFTYCRFLTNIEFKKCFVEYCKIKDFYSQEFFLFFFLNIDYIQIPATKKKKDTKCESQLSKQNLKKIKTKAWIACLFLQCNFESARKSCINAVVCKCNTCLY